MPDINEWIDLIIEARELGITVDEVREWMESCEKGVSR